MTAADALATVTAAAAATLARGTATFTFVRQDRPSDASEELAREHGPLKEVRARRRSRWLKVLDDKARPLFSTGILDLPGSRCAMPDAKHARSLASDARDWSATVTPALRQPSRACLVECSAGRGRPRFRDHLGL